jgi:ankyrin repeat protein
MAIEELVTLATEMTKPFVQDPRYLEPRVSMPGVDLRVNAMRGFAHKLESRALQLNAGRAVSFAQSALGSKCTSKTSTWTSDQSMIQRVQDSISKWDTPVYVGLSHVIQMKLLRDHPHLRSSNAELFLHYREVFLEATAKLFDRIPIDVPNSIKHSQMFVPHAFASIHTIASGLSRHKPDCLGRSVSHILHDAGVLSEWSLADTHSSDSLGRTGLYLACRDRNQLSVRRLLDAWADPSIEAANGLYPLDMAAISGDLEICSMIWKKEMENSRQMDIRYDNSLGIPRRSPVVWAAFFGHDRIFKLFRQFRDTHPNATAYMDGSFCNACGLAVMRGHLNLISYLASNNYLCDIPDLHGRSPFWYAAASGRCDILKILEPKAIFVDRADENGFTPLAIAAHKGHFDVVSYLLKFHQTYPIPLVDVSAKNKSGDTPLFLAASAQRKKCVVRLLGLGLEPLGVANIHRAYQMALKESYHDILKLFHDRGFVFP